MEKAIKSRRAVLAAFGAFAAGLLAVPANAVETAQSLPPGMAAGLRFRAIKVDVAPLAQDAGGPTAGWMAQALPGPLQTAFSSRIAPGDRAAPTLVVRIDRVFLGVSDNGEVGPTAASEARDNVEGAGVVVAPDGRTLGVYPLFTTLNNFTGGSNFEMGTEQRRVDELAKSFAYWLPGQMGL